MPGCPGRPQYDSEVGVRRQLARDILQSCLSVTVAVLPRGQSPLPAPLVWKWLQKHEMQLLAVDRQLVDDLFAPPFLPSVGEQMSPVGSHSGSSGQVTLVLSLSPDAPFQMWTRSIASFTLGFTEVQNLLQGQREQELT